MGSLLVAEKASPNPVTVRRLLKPYSPYHSSTFASEREATGYFDKDVGTDLPASPHRYNSERIEIPISSLHRDANAPAALLHDEVVDEIPQGKILIEYGWLGFCLPH